MRDIENPLLQMAVISAGHIMAFLVTPQAYPNKSSDLSYWLRLENMIVLLLLIILWDCHLQRE